ncbi:unnamed protein product [Cylicocyclus nassatus]|uniref:BZIP domain-containing protein n=1 Tax=Cylicocyclus nassatus TaxID=53992 RepID=A0AA36GFY5_CYLNA|nr:unnamed protein product [Cylicocyclus nassatus]
MHSSPPACNRRYPPEKMRMPTTTFKFTTYKDIVQYFTRASRMGNLAFFTATFQANQQRKMSESLCFSSAEGLDSFNDVILSSATVDTCGVWCADESSLATFMEIPQHVRGSQRVNRRCSAFDTERKSLTSPPCDAPPRLVNARHVLVSANQNVVLSEGHTPIISQDTLQSDSILSPLISYSAIEHQPSSTRSPLYNHDSCIYDNTFYSTPNLSAKPFSPDACEQGSQSDNYDSDSSFSHLICSHNADDFGIDISYGRDGSLPGTSPQELKYIDQALDYSFIDEIHKTVREEIEAEKLACSPTSSSAEISQPATPVITLAVNQPVTIVGEDGKEYRVVVQAVEKNEVKCKRKRVNLKDAPVPKRAKGVPLANMSFEEISRRKREQNRIAAQRYREKQRTVKSAEKQEEERLEKRNAFLRLEAERLQKEIAALRELLLGKGGMLSAALD